METPRQSSASTRPRRARSGSACERRVCVRFAFGFQTRARRASPRSAPPRLPQSPRTTLPGTSFKASSMRLMNGRRHNQTGRLRRTAPRFKGLKRDAQPRRRAVDGHAAGQRTVVADEQIRRLRWQADARPNRCRIARPACAINREARIRRALEIRGDGAVYIGIIVRPARTRRNAQRAWRARAANRMTVLPRVRPAPMRR